MMDKWESAIKLIGVGFYISACIIGGVLGGLWLDRTFNTGPIFLLIGLIIGLVAAFWGVYQMLLPMIKDNKRERR
jgi:ATP synthase protein I